MAWVIALLAVGCVFFAAQVVVDYLRYRRVIEPRLERAEKARQDLRSRIDSTEAELLETRQELGPAHEEVEQLERQYGELHEQVKAERGRQREGRQPPPQVP